MSRDSFHSGVCCNFLGKKKQPKHPSKNLPKLVKAPTLQHLAFSLAMKGRRGATHGFHPRQPGGFAVGSVGVLGLFAFFGGKTCVFSFVLGVEHC